MRIAAILFGGVCCLHAGQIFSVVNLGIFPNGSISSGRGVSSNGMAAGTADTDPTSFSAFAWVAGTLTAVGPSGSTLSFGSGINSSGYVVGFALDSTSGTLNAFLWNGSSVLPIATIGGANNAATGINDAGTVVGFSEIAGGAVQAFQYSGGSPVGIGTLPGGSNSSANGINASGSIVGTSDSTDPNNHAFVYSGGSFTDLGVPAGYASSEGNAISDAGSVAGTLTDGTFVRTAFLWTSGSGVHPLGTLGGDSEAFGVNSSNWVVGASGGAAFLFADSSLSDLNTMMDSTGAGWQLQEALAVNNDGQIVGTGLLDGQPTAFLLTPAGVDAAPEPSTWLLVAGGLAAAARYKSGRKSYV